MKEEIVQRLDILAGKLGVATEHLWGVLVKQAYINVFSWGLCMLLGIILIYVTIRFGKFISDKIDKDDWDNDAIAFPIFAGIITAVVWGFVLFKGVPKIMVGLFNPEYFALQEILKILN